MATHRRYEILSCIAGCCICLTTFKLIHKTVVAARFKILLEVYNGLVVVSKYVFVGSIVCNVMRVICSAFMVGLYSYSVHRDVGIVLVYHGVTADIEDKLCIAIYCVEIIFNTLLVYGAHTKTMSHLRIFYYYAIATTVALVLLEFVTTIGYGLYEDLELLGLFFAGLCIHLYLLFLVRSILKKMDMSGQEYVNQLHQFVNGEVNVEGSVVYQSTVIPNDVV